MVDKDGKATYSTSLVNFEAKERLLIYPNPSSNQFYVQVPDNLENITVYGAAGKVVFINISGKGNTRTLDASTFAPGLYNIHTKAGNRIMITKALKR